MALTGRKIAFNSVCYVDDRLGFRFVKRQIPLDCCTKDESELLHYEQLVNIEAPAFYPQKVSFCDSSYIQFVSSYQDHTLTLRDQDTNEVIETFDVKKIDNQDFVIEPPLAFPSVIIFASNLEFGTTEIRFGGVLGYTLNGVGIGYSDMIETLSNQVGKTIELITANGYVYRPKIERVIFENVLQVILDQTIDFGAFASPWITSFRYTLRSDLAYYYELDISAGPKTIDWYDILELNGVGCFYLCLQATGLDGYAEDTNPALRFPTTVYDNTNLRSEPIKLLAKGLDQGTIKVEYYSEASSRDDGLILWDDEIKKNRLFVRVDGDFQALTEPEIEDENYRLSQGQKLNIYSSTMTSKILNIRSIQQYIHVILRRAIRTSDFLYINNVAYSSSGNNYELKQASQDGLRGASIRLLEQDSTRYNRN